MKPRSAAADEGARLVQEEGLTIAAAARRVGVVPSTVWKRLNPERSKELDRRSNANRNAAKRAWEEEHRAPCKVCGQPLGPGTARSDGSLTRVATGICADCHHQRRVERLRRIRELRVNERLSRRQIALRLQADVLTVTQELTRMRAAGLEVELDPAYYVDPTPWKRASPDWLAPSDWIVLRDAFPDELGSLAA